MGCSFKDEKGVTVVNAFQKLLDNSAKKQNQSKGRKPNRIWIDKGSKFYNNSFKKWLKGNDIKIYSIHNEGKSVVAERFIKTLKNEI